MATILVTGGTGTLGRALVDRLLAAGHQVRVASRRPRPAEPTRYGWATVDYTTGAGLPDAIRGVDTVVHCASGIRGRNLMADTDTTRTLTEAARAAGGPHLVYISIVGVDRVPFAYYRGKLGAERVIEESGLPYTILRATQFYNLIEAFFRYLTKLPVLFVPAFSFQPVDVREVADRLAELAAGEPSGRVGDLAGPAVRTARELARAYLRATNRRRPIVAVRLPGKAFRGYRRGGHLAPDRAAGRITFEQFLAERTSTLQ